MDLPIYSVASDLFLLYLRGLDENVHNLFFQIMFSHQRIYQFPRLFEPAYYKVQSFLVWVRLIRHSYTLEVVGIGILTPWHLEARECLFLTVGIRS
mgnify:CR=1 FL=1